ncbi:YeeE/YedE thiosulfate transporter family protein [Sulfurimonas sp. C5]|uniref:YeeE/YedE thiosulfate transporter family protein n=1 Tax=Sulfurimonas sp. C5 TaxID=3036947 RepID=UPI0024560EA9|nr:YeeE/YedE thiosulfate transporter family protein [Sulfurimonas sp. C5]MDH4943816.1 YeeE/YedE thiosulfate transporter family protein [Sulfurimonas sp. C5]
MFELVQNQEHGSIALVLFIGFLFGLIIMYSRLDKFEKMAGFLLFEDTLAIRMAMTTVGISSIGFYILVANGYATFSPKTAIIGGLILGGVIFGIGLVMLGKCPSAFFVSVSEGRIDAFVGVIGGMIGGLIFTYSFPFIKSILGPDYGQIRLPDFAIEYGGIITIGFGIIMLIGAYMLPTLNYVDKAEEEKINTRK